MYLYWGIVLLKKEDYLKEMELLLSDRDTYTILKKDPINIYKKSLNSIVQDELDFLIPLAP